MKEFNIEERVEKAKTLFLNGFNCSQAVFLAYSDLFDIDIEMAKSMTVSFGGGVGRMREICGTVSAIAMLAGFKHPVSDPRDITRRTENYSVVQELAEQFKQKHHSLVCRELLPAAEAASNNPVPSSRTPQYYEKRPCLLYVEDAARMAGDMLQKV
jgi:C_GCAxxG_C_C family probable redox protein